ncbi:uncharacterized protein [Primulina eburnea]|uniref:uncharacterized protein n=1 Tax=Primulina eburnea TaxID=1245227 RepID=UPI003C6C487B
MVPVGGIACCFSAAAIYLLGRSSGRDADVLKSVIRVDRLKDLGLCSAIFYCTEFNQAVKDDIGAIRIQRPHKGPFYVFDKPIDELIANLGKWSRNNFYKDWSVNRKQREVSFYCNRRCLAKGWSMFQENHESNSLLSRFDVISGDVIYSFWMSHTFDYFRELTNGSMKATTYKKKDAICQNSQIFVNLMLSRSLRSAPSRPVPVENGSSMHEESSFKSINKTLSSDLVVEFRHADLEGSKASVHASKKGDLILGNERTIIRKIPNEKAEGLSQSPRKKDGFQILQKTGGKYQEKELQDLEILKGTDARFKSLKTSNPAQESVDLSAGQAMKQKHWLLLREDSKINEKSAEFIETRREAMRKTQLLDNN